MTTRLRRFLMGSGVLLGLACFAPELLYPPLVMMRPLFVGWLALPMRTIPLMHGEPMTIVSAIVYAAAFVGGLHLLIGKCAGRGDGRLTASIGALPVLMFVAGTAAVAVVTQVEELAGEPLFRARSRRRAEQSFPRAVGQDEPRDESEMRADRAELPYRTSAESEHDHFVVVHRPDGSVGAVATFARDPARREGVTVRTADTRTVVTFDEFQRIRREVEAGGPAEPKRAP